MFATISFISELQDSPQLIQHKNVTKVFAQDNCDRINCLRKNVVQSILQQIFNIVTALEHSVNTSIAKDKIHKEWEYNSFFIQAFMVTVVSKSNASMLQWSNTIYT